MKKRLLAPVLLAGLFATSCIGPMNAYKSVLHWNSQVSESKWLNELLFLPVYPIAMPIAALGDVLIFNSIEFWGGNNPISAPEPFTPQNKGDE